MSKNTIAQDTPGQSGSTLDEAFESEALWEQTNPLATSGEIGSVALIELKLEPIIASIRDNKIEILGLSPEERAIQIIELAKEVASSLCMPIDKAMKVVIRIWNSTIIN